MFRERGAGMSLSEQRKELQLLIRSCRYITKNEIYNIEMMIYNQDKQFIKNLKTNNLKVYKRAKQIGVRSYRDAFLLLMENLNPEGSDLPFIDKEFGEDLI